MAAEYEIEDGRVLSRKIREIELAFCEAWFRLVERRKVVTDTFASPRKRFKQSGAAMQELIADLRREIGLLRPTGSDMEDPALQYALDVLSAEAECRLDHADDIGEFPRGRRLESEPLVTVAEEVIATWEMLKGEPFGDRSEVVIDEITGDPVSGPEGDKILKFQSEAGHFFVAVAKLLNADYKESTVAYLLDQRRKSGSPPAPRVKSDCT